MIKSILIANALNLKQENGYYIQGVQNLGYSTKYPISDILQKHGVKIGNVLFKNKAFSVTLQILGTSFSDLESKRSTLFQYLTVNPYAEDDKIEFEFTLLNNQVVTLSGVIKQVNSDVSKDDLLLNTVNFVVETEYPFLLSKQIYQQNIGISIGGGAAVPMEIPLDFTAGAALYTTITNAGNVFAFPVFKFYGQLTNPVLTDVLNNVSMSLDMTIASGDWIEIDTYNQTIIDQDGNNQLDKLLDDFLRLMVGVNNFQLLSDDAGDDGYIEVTWQYHYVSI